MGKSAPKAPDPVATANAQAAMNKDTAIAQAGLNMVNQSNPLGSISYNQIGQWSDGTPRYSQTTSYTPAGQQISDNTIAAQKNLSALGSKLSQNLQGVLGKTYTGQGLPPIQTNLGQQTNIGNGYNANFSGDLGADYATSLGDDYSGVRDDYTNALMARNAGNRAADESSLRTTLANKGIVEGSPAWNAEMERLGRQNTDERYAAILAGGAEQQNALAMALANAQFGNESSLNAANFGSQQQQAQNAAALSQAGFSNQARAANVQFNNQAGDQQLARDMAIRNQPVNEISALLSGSQIASPTSMASATPQTAIGGVDYSGLVQKNYESQVTAHSDKLGGIGGLFGTVLGGPIGGAIGGMISDRRLKTNIELVGRTAGGYNVYSYNYIWGGPVHIGVMAQEVPHAARVHDSGYLMVDYSEVN